MNSIESLIVPHSFDHVVTTSKNTRIIITCKYDSYDPNQLNKKETKILPFTLKPTDKIETIFKRIKSRDQNVTFGEDTYIKYNYHLYKEGTIQEIGINSNDTIEVISLESEQEATKNEGFIFAFWSLVPLMVSISFLVPGLIGTFDMVYRGLFMLVGTIIGIPASILLIIGLTERFSSSMRISFVNYSWFGPCCNCSCCNCCGCCHCCSCCGCDQTAIEQDNIDESPKGKKSSKRKGHHDDEDQLIDVDQNTASELTI